MVKENIYYVTEAIGGQSDTNLVYAIAILCYFTIGNLKYWFIPASPFNKWALCFYFSCVNIYITYSTLLKKIILVYHIIY